MSKAYSLTLEGKRYCQRLAGNTSASKGFISYPAALRYEAAIRKAPTISRWVGYMGAGYGEGDQIWLRDIARAV
jgi:hypothetical protein